MKSLDSTENKPPALSGWGFRKFVISQLYNHHLQPRLPNKRLVAKTQTELLWKHSGWCLLMPVWVDQSEPTGLKETGSWTEPLRQRSNKIRYQITMNVINKAWMTRRGEAAAGQLTSLLRCHCCRWGLLQLSANRTAPSGNPSYWAWRDSALPMTDYYERTSHWEGTWRRDYHHCWLYL